MNKNWFTRFYQEGIDSNYLHNMIELTQHFIGWFKWGKISYAEMLLESHEIATQDYMGYTKGNSEPHKGFRTTDIPVVALNKKWYVNEKTHDFIPKIPSVSVVHRHRIEISKSAYLLNLPLANYLPVYLYNMDRVVGELRHEIKLEKLAEYIQLFVIGHPFYKVNFSICMAQVNTLLSLAGYSPIYHGYLDFNCFLYDYDMLKEIFINKVKGIEYKKEYRED